MDITPRYEHSKIGNLLFNLTARWTKFLCDHKVLFYLLASTWGIILTVFGVIVTAVLAIAELFGADIKFVACDWVYGIRVGQHWGGFETGLMYVRDDSTKSRSIDNHEYGHLFQNTLFGPFTPLLITIPSAVRYWIRTLAPKSKIAKQPYNQFWAEDSASECGAYVYKKHLAEKKAREKKEVTKNG